jgi:hypothetical protein
MGAIVDAGDLLEVALDDAGLTVVRDPGKLDPPCALIGLPDFSAPNRNVVDCTVPVYLVGLPPNNLDANLGLLDMADTIAALPGVLITSGTPATFDISDHSLPAYNLTVQVTVTR